MSERALCARLLEASDAERARIGSALHDGAQQRLVALGHMLALAERRLDEDPAAARALMAQAREQVALAGEELRELVRGLHPAGLAEHGLRHVLAALAARSTVPLRIDALPEERLPAVVEATVLALVVEALEHPATAGVRIDARVDGERLHVAVVGAGRPTSATLADRVAALGGTLRGDSAGARLDASMPLRRRPYGSRAGARGPRGAT
jgi:signal transduction histidine kinase